MDELQGLAFFRLGPEPLLAAQVPTDARTKLVSRLADWLLEEAMPSFATAELRALATRIQQLHRDRARGLPIDPDEWTQARADSLYATRLWPPEWLATGDLPGSPPIVRSIIAGTIAIGRRMPDRNAGHPQMRQRLVDCLNYLCVIYRAPLHQYEAQLQRLAQDGSPAEYSKWLTKHDPAVAAYVIKWLGQASAT